VLGDEHCHLKHTNGALATKNGFKASVSINVALVGRVLEVISCFLLFLTLLDNFIINGVKKTRVSMR